MSYISASASATTRAILSELISANGGVTTIEFHAEFAARAKAIRIGQLSIDSVPAAVIENLDQSLLGMSFLTRLKSFEMREGALTISW
jgi:clan AA aspartic protease (TIGR02281 family)